MNRINPDLFTYTKLLYKRTTYITLNSFFKKRHFVQVKTIGKKTYTCTLKKIKHAQTVPISENKTMTMTKFDSLLLKSFYFRWYEKTETLLSILELFYVLYDDDTLKTEAWVHIFLNRFWDTRFSLKKMRSQHFYNNFEACKHVFAVHMHIFTFSLKIA